MDYVSINNVPLLKVGTWNASVGGTLPVTKNDLKELADSATDTDLDSAVIKIGHTDGRFPPVTDDGEPAYGQVTNLRLSEDGNTLFGDFVNVPASLAEKLESAYPYRSAEFRSNVALKDAAGKIVKQFKKVLTAVALLGATPPAVKGLGSVHAAFSDGHELDAETGNRVELRLGQPLTAEQLKTALTTVISDQTNTPVVVVDFTDKLAWYWEDTGQSEPAWFQQKYTETEGVVSLDGDRVQVEPLVQETFVPKQETQGDTPPVPLLADENAQADNEQPTERTSRMATLADIFTAVSATTPEGADYTTIEVPDEAVEAIAQAFQDAKEQAVENTGEENTELAEAPTGQVTLSEAQFNEMKAENASMRNQLDKLTARADAQRRDQIIENALSEGRLHPSDSKAWRDALDKNEEGTVTLINSLSPIVAMSEYGSDVGVEAKTLAEAQEDAVTKYEASIFGED